MLRFVLAIVALLVLSRISLAQSNRLTPFVLPWDDASDGVSNLSGWLAAPAGKDGFVTAGRDGRLYAGGKRLRMLGVNVCFSANFPQRGDAEKIAARMARFGIGCVRFHHMDTADSPRGLLARDRKTIDPKQLDKLDYFIAQLKKHGIYSNINLHVGRNYPGLPEWNATSFYKGVDLFLPAAIEMQKDYARELLTHVNPYTKTRHADEPAVAFVEINNENGLLQEWLAGNLDNMPPAIGGELARQWNAWLARRYPKPDGLAGAWRKGEQPLGKDMLVNGRFSDNTTGWFLEQHGKSKAAVRATRDGDQRAARIDVQAVGEAGWHVQFSQAALKLRHGQSYTLKFRARADGPRRIIINASQAHEPWSGLWSTAINLTEKWQDFTLVLMPAESDDNARIVFSDLAGKLGSVWLADVSLRPGGLLGLRDGEPVGQVPAFRKIDMAGRTVAAQRDWMQFLWDTERAYWIGMRDFVRNDCGSRSLVVGTIVGCSTPTLMADFDVIDVHGYWQHPRFPRRPWDAVDWTVGNVSMVNSAGGVPATMAMKRVVGKPLICTEYNHSSPNTFSGEAPLLLAAVAAVQDWDAIFLFSYSHRNDDDWNARRIPNFFDIDQHPTKMANMPAAAAIFCRGDLRPADKLVANVLAPQNELELLRTKAHAWRLVDSGHLGIPAETALVNRIGVHLGDGIAPQSVPAAVGQDRLFTSDHGQLVWDLRRNGAGVVTLNTARSKAVVGFVAGRSFELGDVTIAPGATRQDWCTITLTLISGESFAGPGRTLIAATGYTENTDMGWKNAEKTTVGRDWGKAPSLVEVLPATITLPSSPAKTQVWALDERGQRGRKIAVNDIAGKAVVELTPESKTLWYEVEVE